jgi:hypothetical protein
LAGWRTGHKRLDAHRFHLDETVFSELRELCEPTLEFLTTAQEREYEQFGALEPGEQFFSYDISGLPRHPATIAPMVENPGSPEDDTADLVRLVRTVDALPEITRSDMDEGGYTFYGICWPHNDSMVGFVSKTDPMTTLSPGYRYFQYGETLRTVVHPDLALKEGCDIVVGAERLAILRPAAFNVLLGDVGVIFQGAPDDVKSLRTALKETIPMADDATVAVLSEAQRLGSYARRLRLLPDRLASIPALDVRTLRRSLRKHGVDPALLIDRSGQFSFDTEQVDLFLDVLEGRYFEDDLGGEHRRADRYSRRT